MIFTNDRSDYSKIWTVHASHGIGLTARLDRKRLPKTWRSYPAPPELQLLGDEWVRSGTAAVLEVPSAVIDTESNYLLNPRHRDFPSITIGPPQPFALDLRLLRS